MKLIIPSIFVCVLMTLPVIGSARTCRVYCPDGSSFVQDCNSNRDPCTSSNGSKKVSPGYDYGAAQRAQQAAEEAERPGRRGALRLPTPLRTGLVSFQT
jgi:hypothetical protein